MITLSCLRKYVEYSGNVSSIRPKKKIGPIIPLDQLSFALRKKVLATQFDSVTRKKGEGEKEKRKKERTTVLLGG